VFVASVFGATVIFGLILLFLKCLEQRCSSAVVARDGQEPTAEDHTATFLIEPDRQPQAEGKRWREKLAELLEQVWLLSATNRQSQFECV